MYRGFSAQSASWCFLMGGSEDFPRLSQRWSRQATSYADYLARLRIRLGSLWQMNQPRLGN